MTFESWTRIGQEDAKSLDVYKKAGNEIIELTPEVQFKVRQIADQWADEQAAKDAWFKKVLESQRNFEKMWGNADDYRKVKVAR